MIFFEYNFIIIACFVGIYVVFIMNYKLRVFFKYFEQYIVKIEFIHLISKQLEFNIEITQIVECVAMNLRSL